MIARESNEWNGARPAGRSDRVDSALRDVSAAVLAITEPRSVRDALQVIVASARSLLRARFAAIGVPDDGGGFAEFVVDGVSDEQWRAIGPLPRQHGVLGAMVAEGRSVRIADIRMHDRFVGWPAAHPALKDFLGVPIVADDRLRGIIYLANKRERGGFTARDQELASLFAGHAAIALRNADRYEHERELTVVRERTRLARELHDAVSQKLFSIRLAAGTAAALVETDAERTAGELDRVQRLAAEALSELRAVIVELRPAQLADDGLVESLRKHATVLDRVHEPAVVFEHDAECLCDVSGQREAVVFRVAQEALHNALRYAGAERITVALRRERSELALSVIDDGGGFEPDATSRGLGMASMRERAASVGGTLTVDSGIDRGTRVHLRVPCGDDAVGGPHGQPLGDGE